ncbi:MAG: peptidoglycan-binding protein [Candidatus Pacebacteria bacterium]|nr:peptidoglycan-binding protein [Candidatus Paceibacterota bacterium]
MTSYQSYITRSLTLITIFALVFLPTVLFAGPATLVSVNEAGTDSGNGSSYAYHITPDGRYVVFSSDASDLVSNDTNGQQDVFVQALFINTPTIDPLTTTNTTPTITGTWDHLHGVELTVTIDGTTYTLGTDPELTTDGGENWTLTLTTPLAPASYTVEAMNENFFATADATENIVIQDTSTPPTSGGTSSSGGSIVYSCKDPEATNYRNIGNHAPSLCTYAQDTTTPPPTPTNPLITGELTDTALSLLLENKTCNYFTEYMELGDKDGLRGKRTGTPLTQVKLLQQVLNLLGYHAGTPDGTFGPQTKQAVMNFQERFRPQVLNPWNLRQPTGLFYQSTSVRLNRSLGCEDSKTLDNGVFVDGVKSF